MEKVTSVAQLVEALFEGKRVRTIRGSRFYDVKGVEYDEQVGCVTLIVEGRRPILLFWNEKFLIDVVEKVERGR